MLRQARKHFAYGSHGIATLCALALALVAGHASAQGGGSTSSSILPPGAAGGSSSSGGGWLADRDATQGPGFRVGDLELHPGLGVEVGYDSNLYYTDDNPTPPIHRVDTGILRVTPHLLFSTLTGERARGGGEGSQSSAPPTVTFQGGISAAYYEFFADPNRRNLALDVGMRLTVLPQRPFGFSVYDTFSRAVRPFVENINSSTGMARDTNNAGLQLHFQTDGGVLQVNAGYDFGLRFYEDGSFQYNNAFVHTMSLQETYRFLPQTAIVQDNQVHYTDYFNASSTSLPVRLGDSWQLQSRIGLNGAISNNISLSGLVGYAAGFFANPGAATYVQNYDGPVAQVSLGWTIQQGTRLSLGYNRSFQTAILGNYSSNDRGYASFSTTIGGSFLLSIGADVTYADYGIIVGPPGSAPCSVGSSGSGGACVPSREDIRVTGTVFAEYRLTDWLGINTTLRYMGDFTDFHYNVATMMGMAPLVDPAGYNKFEAFLGVRVFY